MWVTKEVAIQVEACIKQTHIEVTHQYPHGKIYEVNGGVACFSGYDSYLSQVVGWGFATKPRHFKTDLEMIEQFYKSFGHQRVDIELCPYTGTELASFLSQRNYEITELNNVSILDLRNHPITTLNEEEFVIRQVPFIELSYWAQNVAAGFGYPKAQEQFIHYARAKGVTAFAALKKDKIVAGATIAIHQGVADLGVTSTIPAFRGRGLQKQLVLARLNFARNLGVSMATVTTEPGTISDLNVQKSGFNCAYTRIKMTRSF